MPVILDVKDCDRWLEPGDPLRPPIDLLRPHPAELMRDWRIGPGVGKGLNNRPDLIDRSMVAFFLLAAACSISIPFPLLRAVESLQ